MFLPQEDRVTSPTREHYPFPKLSDAIRIGAQKREQCRGYLFKEGRSCALGAAYEALGFVPVEGDSKVAGYMQQYFKLYDRYGESICDQVQVRNDRGQTREQIADWLESQGL